MAAVELITCQCVKLLARWETCQSGKLVILHIKITFSSVVRSHVFGGRFKLVRCVTGSNVSRTLFLCTVPSEPAKVEKMEESRPFPFPQMTTQVQVSRAAPCCSCRDSTSPPRPRKNTPPLRVHHSSAAKQLGALASDTDNKHVHVLAVLLI
eukprot:g8157.t1